MKKIKYWLILEKSEETRISHSFDSYDDTTGEIYNYDNSVPNYRNVNRGDLIIIRKENQIVGSGTIEKIDKSPSEKERRRCPSCDKTDIRKRVSKIPQWKCGSCSYEFDNPTSTIDPIIAYSATISSYSKINNPPDYKEVKDCSVLDNGRSNQNSIIELDKNKVELLFSDFSFEVNKKSLIKDKSKTKKTKQVSSGQGFGLSKPEKDAIEDHSMEIVKKLYLDQGWNVIDKHKTKPYDFLALKNGKRKYIEVKGTKGLGKSVILTGNEVRHAKSHNTESALIVVGNIKLKSINTKWIAFGGEILFNKDPWIIDKDDLTVTEYRLKLK